MNQSISVPYRMKIQSYSPIDSCLSLCSNSAQLACDQSGKWTSLAEMEHKEDMNEFSCNFGFSFCVLWRCCSGTYDRKIGVGVRGPNVYAYILYILHYFVVHFGFDLEKVQTLLSRSSILIKYSEYTCFIARMYVHFPYLKSLMRKNVAHFWKVLNSLGIRSHLAINSKLENEF